jgi:hypothetical protein
VGRVVLCTVEHGHNTLRVVWGGLTECTRQGKGEMASGSSWLVSRVGSCAGLGLKSGSAAGELESG